MLSTRPCVAHLPPIPIPPLDLDFSHRSPSLCSTASSSSIHSTYTSSSSSYPASGSSSTCPPSFQDAQTEAPHLRRKGSRPLPSIPSTSTTPTSAGISTPPCSASSAGRSSLRPLPRPPVQEKTSSSPLLDIPRCSAPIRPLPTPCPSSGSLRATPVPPASSSITPSQAHCKPAPLKPNRHPFPSLSLRIDAPGRSTTEIILESPIGPISPLVFNRPLSLFPGTTEEDESRHEEVREDTLASADAVMAQEAQVAKRLGELGFVEMDDPRHSSYSDSSESSYGSVLPSSEPSSRPGTSMSTFSTNRLLPPRWDSHRPKFNVSTACVKPESETVVQCTSEPEVIRVELLTAQTPAKGKSKRTSRSSRMWVREKKGKRWVENDYFEVLNLLRKL